MTSGPVKCSFCEKTIRFFAEYRGNYAYKIIGRNNEIVYQCGYSCWRKENKRMEENGTKAKRIDF